MNDIGPNFIARPYRGVSVQEVPSLDPDALRGHLRARPVYRRTEFVVAVHDGRRALVALDRAPGDDVLVPVADVRILAGPDEVAFVSDASVDTGNANHMARAARATGRSARAYVVEGRFQHVNFLLEPAPIPIRVVEVVPPFPAKLLAMAETVLDYDEDLPPVDLELAPIDLRELASSHPSEHYLFPCRCAGLDLDARVDFLDAGPPADADWTLIGCERSRQIHVALYGREPAARVDFCPLRTGPRSDGLTLTKCCLRERGLDVADGRAVVPWGASLEEVRAALHALTGAGTLAGAPA